jgi:trimethylamine--corrinoid protein Co-methyltransferase
MRSNYSVNESCQLQVLSDEQCRRLLAVAIEILERTGVIYHDQDSLDIMKRAGCWMGQGFAFPQNSWRELFVPRRGK